MQKRYDCDGSGKGVFHLFSNLAQDRFTHKIGVVALKLCIAEFQIKKGNPIRHI